MLGYLVPISARGQLRLAGRIIGLWFAAVLIIIIKTGCSPWADLLLLTIIPVGFVVWRVIKNGMRVARAEAHVRFGR